MSTNFITILIRKIKLFLKNYETVNKSKAVDIIEYEVNELENIFGLLTLGILIGFPSSPIQVSFALLPEMESNLIHILSKVDTANNPLSELSSILNIG